jgi:hypothetical protein
MYGYDAAAVGIAAIEQAIKELGGKKPTRAQVSAAVRKIKDFKALTGSITFDGKGDPVKTKYFVLKFETRQYPGKCQNGGYDSPQAKNYRSSSAARVAWAFFAMRKTPRRRIFRGKIRRARDIDPFRPERRPGDQRQEKYDVVLIGTTRRAGGISTTMRGCWSRRTVPGDSFRARAGRLWRWCREDPGQWLPLGPAQRTRGRDFPVLRSTFGEDGTAGLLKMVKPPFVGAGVLARRRHGKDADEAAVRDAGIRSPGLTVRRSDESILPAAERAGFAAFRQA